MKKTERSWVSRMIRTFVQTAIGCLAVGLPTINFNDGWDIVKKSLIGIAITAVASGLAAAMNIYDERAKAKEEEEEETKEEIEELKEEVKELEDEQNEVVVDVEETPIEDEK